MAYSLLLAIVQHEDADAAVQALTQGNFQVTRISSLGGFLRTGNATLLLGLEDTRVPQAIARLAQTCHRRSAFINAEPTLPALATPNLATPIQVEIGGAIIFALPLTRHIHLSAGERRVLESRREKKAMPIKLIMAIVPEGMASQVLDALIAAQYRATLISTTGGFLRQGNATVLVGVAADRVEDAQARIEQVCREAQAHATESWATLFVLDVAQYELR